MWPHSHAIMQFTATADPLNPSAEAHIVETESATGLVLITDLKPSTEYKFEVKEKDSNWLPDRIGTRTTLPLGKLFRMIIGHTHGVPTTAFSIGEVNLHNSLTHFNSSLMQAHQCGCVNHRIGRIATTGFLVQIRMY